MLSKYESSEYDRFTALISNMIKIYIIVQCLHLTDIFPHRFPERQPDRAQAHRSATISILVSAMNVLVKWWVVPTLDYWNLLYSSCITWKPPTIIHFFSKNNPKQLLTRSNQDKTQKCGFLSSAFKERILWQFL